MARVFSEQETIYLEEQKKPEEQARPIEEQNATIKSSTLSRWQNIVFQVGRFGVVGVFNTLLDLCLFNTLLWVFPTQNTLLILAYNSIAYAIGAINSFFLNKYWTFQRNHAVTKSEIVRFLLTTGAGILCSDCILWIAGLLLSHVAGNQVLMNNVAKLVAVFGTASVSYLGMHLWVFVRKSEAE